MFKTLITIVCAVSTALSFSNFSTISEGVSSGSIYPYYGNGDKPPVYTYNYTNDNKFRIVRNIKDLLSTQTNVFPQSEKTMETGEYKRPLPLNYQEAERKVSSAVKYTLNEAMMYDTSNLQTCIALPLCTGEYNNYSATPSTWGIRERNLDFYCEVSGLSTASDMGKGMKAMLFLTWIIYNSPSELNTIATETNSIWLNVNTIGKDENNYPIMSISGYIPEDSEFWSSLNWTNISYRLYLVVFNEAKSNFGCSGLGTNITFIFPNRNADIWNRVEIVNYNVTNKENTIANALNATNFTTFINNATAIFSNSAMAMQFWATPIGAIMSIPNIAGVVMLALIFITLEKILQ